MDTLARRLAAIVAALIEAIAEPMPNDFREKLALAAAAIVADTIFGALNAARKGRLTSQSFRVKLCAKMIQYAALFCIFYSLSALADRWDLLNGYLLALVFTELYSIAETVRECESDGVRIPYLSVLSRMLERSSRNVPTEIDPQPQPPTSQPPAGDVSRSTDQS